MTSSSDYPKTFGMSKRMTPLLLAMMLAVSPGAAHAREAHTRHPFLAQQLYRPVPVIAVIHAVSQPAQAAQFEIPGRADISQILVAGSATQ